MRIWEFREIRWEVFFSCIFLSFNIFLLVVFFEEILVFVFWGFVVLVKLLD